MNVTFSIKYAKDYKKIKDKSILTKIENAIDSVENAEKITDIPNLKKIKGNKTAYRIRKGDIRIGLFISGNEAEFDQVKKRSDIYKYFPIFFKLLLKF